MSNDLTKSEIFQELEELKVSGYNMRAFIIVNDAAKILNDVELNITYNSDEKPKNLDIWVEPKYYDYLVKCEGMMEQIMDEPCIGIPYTYKEDVDGAIMLYKGTKNKPASKLIGGYKVQGIESGAMSKPKSNLTKFRVVK